MSITEENHQNETIRNIN